MSYVYFAIGFFTLLLCLSCLTGAVGCAATGYWREAIGLVALAAVLASITLWSTDEGAKL